MTKVKKVGGEVVHFVALVRSLRMGTAVTGQLDWERRYPLMRTHTAMHILCGVVWRDYGASVTGGNMEPLKGRMDFEFETMRQELVAEIETAVNVEVDAARETRVQILPREEAFQIPDLIRTKINLLPEGIKEVRTVGTGWAGFAGRWRHACQKHERSRYHAHHQLQKQRQNQQAHLRGIGLRCRNN